MRKNPFIAIGYWTLFVVNLWLGCKFAAFYPDQIPNELVAEISQLNFALRIMQLLAYICKNWRGKKSQNSLKKRVGVKAIIISASSYLMGIGLILWAAPTMWTFIIGHLLLLAGGYHFGKQLAKISEHKKKEASMEDQPPS